MNDQAPQTESPAKSVIRVLESDSMREKLITTLPPDIKPDRFTRVVITAINMRPELLEADRQSLYTACMKAAQDGLLPDGREGVLNIYNTNVGTKQAPRWIKGVQWMPMVEGVIKQMAKAGISCYAAAVYQNDKIRIWNDDRGQHVEHEPALFSPDRGPLIGAYARGRDRNGNVQVEVMNMDELNRARQASRNADGAVYQQWPDRMAQKTVLHRLRKRMALIDPSVAEALARAEQDDLIDADDPPPIPASEIVPPPVSQPRPRALQAVIDHAKQDEQPPVDADPPQRAVSPGPPVPPPDDRGFEDF